MNRIDINSLKQKIDHIELQGDYWNDEFIPGPTADVLQQSRQFIKQLEYNNIVPIRITQSIEEGICFVFSKEKYILYFEIYNDGELGYIIEKVDDKKVIENLEIHSISSIMKRIVNFYF